ncbi:diguanylate cyclase (GGDEF) domain-containing protein [Idiomarina sp. A28L]|uniref:putative bifunctional diguanylate cyclase/phosphodiesterase n=1 Tax=Idiomarina sp. A28L TaxID=1036674 RepID=UPI00021389D9|nr:EAL domain-containing protein [Idiomarina sp. A28L]EGN74519.1 diguanylate cyclase (GGDEF) domain-containing protein [Idiomarina sp. A28L]
MKRHAITGNTSAIAVFYTIVVAAVITGIIGLSIFTLKGKSQPLTEVLSPTAAFVSLAIGLSLFGAVRGLPILRFFFGMLVFLAATYSSINSSIWASALDSISGPETSLRWPVSLFFILIGVCLVFGISPTKRRVLWRIGGYSTMLAGLIYSLMCWHSDWFMWFGPHPMVVSISVFFLFLFGVALLIGSYQDSEKELMPKWRAMTMMLASVTVVCSTWFILSSAEVKRVESQILTTMELAQENRERVLTNNVNLMQRLAARWEHIAQGDLTALIELDIANYLNDMQQITSIMLVDADNEILFENTKENASSYWILGTPDVARYFQRTHGASGVLVPLQSIRSEGNPVVLMRLPIYRNSGNEQSELFGYVIALFDFAALINPAKGDLDEILHTYANINNQYLLRGEGNSTHVIDLQRQQPVSLYQHSLDMEIPLGGLVGLVGFYSGVEDLRALANLYTIVIASGLLLSALLVISMEASQILRSQRGQLRIQATHDSLTGLVNRAVLEKHLQEWCEHTVRTGNGIAVAFIDLDGFKPVNDSLGLLVGDKLLQETARRLQNCMRNDAIVGRFGGDEFIVLIPKLRADHPVTDLINDILSSISQPYHIDQYRLYLTASIGITTTLQSPPDPKQLIQHADMAMYQAKRQGRNHYQFYSSEISERFHSSVTLRNELQHVLEQGALKLHYQPIIRCGDRKIVGCEALLRWQKEDGSFVSPADFIPLAEDTGQIIPISAWVLQQACEDGLKFRELGDFSVAVNLSAVQFNRANFIESLTHTLNLSGFPASKLHLELTESVLMEDSARAIKLLESLRKRNFSISIDDFGTGFSSLSYLKMLPIDTLKIDQTFIKDVLSGEHDAAITRTIIGMAQQLHLTVTAEGVETLEQAEFVEQAGCHYMQGFYFARPMSIEELLELVEKQEPL